MGIDLVVQEFPEPTVVWSSKSKAIHMTDDPITEDEVKTLCGKVLTNYKIAGEAFPTGWKPCGKCGPAVDSQARAHRLTH